MKRIITKIVLLLVGFFLPLISSAQDEYFERGILNAYSMPQGLSHYGVTSLLEDQNGLLWVGTFDGLNSYDGFEFKTFRNIKNLNSNRIRSLFQDEYNNIWIGTDHGVSIYNYTTQKFESIYLSQTKKGVKIGPIVRQISKYKGYILCTTEEEGLLFFDPKTYKLKNNITLSESTIAYKTEPLDKHNLLVATSKGLYIVNYPNRTKTRVNGANIDKYIDLVKYNEHRYYSIANNGIVILDHNKGDITLNHILNRQKFQTIHVDSSKNIWLGHKELGLYKTNKEELDQKTKKDILEKEAYPIYRVSTMSSNDKGDFWVGSFRKGLYHLPTKKYNFKYSNLKTNNQSGEWSNHVLNLQKWTDTNVLINVHFRGILNFNTETNSIEPLPPHIKNLAGKANTLLLMDDKGGQFVKLQGKTSRNFYYSKALNKWVPLISKLDPSFANAKMRGVMLDKFGYHWVACSEGLYRLRLTKYGKIEDIQFMDQHQGFSSKSIKEVRCIYEDPKYNYIWIGTKRDGLIRINNNPKRTLKNMRKSQFVHDPDNKYSISSNYVACIQRLDNGELWIGTEEGGICLVENSQLACVFKSFMEKDGLDNNIVKSILPDKEKRLWITTNKGLNAFDLTSRKFRNYTISDGVPISPFEPSATILKNDELIFAGGNGLLYFDPSQIQEEDQMPNLLLGDFKLFNKKVNVLDTLDDHVILPKALNETEKIDLNYDQNIFSLEVISLHYSDKKGNLIRYRMLPQEQEWVTTPSEIKVASFNGLPPGKYTFEAAVSNSKKAWSPSKTIEITIHPPIWKTTVAYILYFVLFVTILFVVIRFILKMNKIEHDLQIEQMDKERIDELNKTRTRMFMNIAHEFRTPLTLISGPLQVLIKIFESNNDAYKHLSLIESQSKKMFQLVNQVQDFQKAEQSLLKLKMTSFEFTSLISEVKKGFNQLAEHTERKFVVNGDANQLFVVADRQKLEIVLNNLLNNAFKFTKSGDTITLNYGVENDKLVFSVSDTGVGIKAKDLPYVFERYYQSEDVNTATVGSGIGLAFSKRIVELHYGTIGVESKVKEGTQFNVILPVEISLEDTFNEERLQEILNMESDDEKQRILPKGIELPESLKDDSLKELNVYYVEDNDDLRDFVHSSLSEYFNVKSFVNGRQCKEAVENEWPDLIISDILMPELNGLELCKGIKADIRTSHIPVILLTSRSSVDDQVSGFESGADAYISKPFDLKQLIATAQMLLKNRRQLRERFRIDFPVEVEKKNNNKSERVFMEKLYALMEKHLDDEELDINIFIKELHLNRTHFYQKVKTITNHTPYELLKLYRLKKAAEMLVNEKLTVSEVYLRTGFKSRTHFSRMFKEHYGITPGKYGKEQAVEVEETA
ncbi:hybrid sensor histidine kinase/response regulator transcription factor [Flammeovirga agarivorans]|uniref:histidine kinase n=1 Tax=Flammeovirga agarivorans TaxID=2726742 RepID=A0A7X8SNM2_9BACT|nr:hybrid sensor histidine kinase/response regulator transcription factor [Flammeovirga agarivorans]NLR93442.1 response regulator [Flammeovirga agarivorans]